VVFPLPWAQGVVGSNPAAPTTFRLLACNEPATGAPLGRRYLAFGGENLSPLFGGSRQRRAFRTRNSPDVLRFDERRRARAHSGCRLRELTRARGIAHSGNSGRDRFDTESAPHPAEGEEPPRGARTDRPATWWWRMPTGIRRQLTPCPLLVPARTGQDQRRRLSGQMLTRKLTRR